MDDEEEIVSRRELFTGWARGLADGLAEWVLPELERETERLREAFSSMDADIAAAPESIQVLRDLLEPRTEDGSEAPRG